MTSSLVGSEMCIRDRSNAAAKFSTKLANVRLAMLAIIGLFFAGAQLREAVSYTHLTLPTICSV
eukprot:358448-Prorocentrum_lima.AAC.1